jgi:hypothetical protein
VVPALSYVKFHFRALYSVHVEATMQSSTWADMDFLFMALFQSDCTVSAEVRLDNAPRDEKVSFRCHSCCIRVASLLSIMNNEIGDHAGYGSAR